MKVTVSKKVNINTPLEALSGLKAGDAFTNPADPPGTLGLVTSAPASTAGNVMVAFLNTGAVNEVPGTLQVRPEPTAAVTY